METRNFKMVKKTSDGLNCDGCYFDYKHFSGGNGCKLNDDLDFALKIMDDVGDCTEDADDIYTLSPLKQTDVNIDYSRIDGK